MRRGRRRPRRSVREAVSYQSRDGCVDVGPAWLSFFAGTEGNCTLRRGGESKNGVAAATARECGGRILAAALKRRNVLSGLRRSRPREYHGFLYVPGLVGVQAGAVILSPGRHFGSVFSLCLSLFAAAVGRVCSIEQRERTSSPLVPLVLSLPSRFHAAIARSVAAAYRRIERCKRGRGIGGRMPLKEGCLSLLFLRFAL